MSTESKQPRSQGSEKPEMSPLGKRLFAVGVLGMELTARRMPERVDEDGFGRRVLLPPVRMED